MAEGRSERDLTLSPNEFAWIRDETAGIIKTYAGPLSTSLSPSERLVVLGKDARYDGRPRFMPAPPDQGVQLKIIAPEGWYVILKNPAADKRQPPEREKATMPDLKTGRKINIAGPTCFSLWPGQMANVVQGHHLRQDEYLLCRVYDEATAQASYDDAVLVTNPAAQEVFEKDRLVTLAGVEKVKPDALEAEERQGEDAPPSEGGNARKLLAKQELTTGKLFVIKGTEVSFYIPPSGIEIKKVDERYVQNAVSLERLEYCLLLDQSGNKRYVRGPAVVFPEPTETFVDAGHDDEKELIRKFRAIELGPKQGIYVKVIADYTENGLTHKVGEELFITGEQMPIYFPREEHLVIKYGDKHTVHCGVAVPAGDARYLLKRLEGKVDLVKGPTVLLPDPRADLIVRRALSPRVCAVLFPGNREVETINQQVAISSADVTTAYNTSGKLDMNVLYGATGMVSPTLESITRASFNLSSNAAAPIAAPLKRPPVGKAIQGDYIDREGQYVAPRSITLNSKYEGAVGVNVWEGYALMLVNKQGGRRIVEGPQTALLEYDEDPHIMAVSTGKPKTTDVLLDVAYLRITNNYVTDMVVADTSDYVNVTIKLTYRLNFTGDDHKKWFSVENYVKLLCDHMRSIIRNKVKQQTVKSFYHDSTNVLRDIILGVSPEDGEGRPGYLFKENGMHVIDVEVLKVSLSDDVQKLLEAQELSTIKRTVELDNLQRNLTFTDEAQKVTFREALIKEETAKLLEDIKRQRILDESVTARAQATAARAKQEATLAIQKDAEKDRGEIDKLIRERRSADIELSLEELGKRNTEDIRIMEADAATTKDKMTTMTPQLIAAIQSVGDHKTVVEVAQAMSAQGLLRTIKGESIVHVMSEVLKNTEVGRRFASANGESRASLPAE